MSEEMQNQTLNKINIEEFSRIQQYMALAEKNSVLYQKLKTRCIELKVILSFSGINLAELERINL